MNCEDVRSDLKIDVVEIDREGLQRDCRGVVVV